MMLKITLSIVGLLAGLLMSFSAIAKEQTVNLKVSGMTCGTCPITVRYSVLKMKGIHTASVDLKTAIATIRYEDTEQSSQAIADRITQLGYPTVIKGATHE